ncbi:MAG TPA: cytochrome C oxidase subunit I [Noviherbaspirillum sp.]|nr:cytochrome C oxidase subunit I [Noviherbaspirillum sp.]
MDQSSKQKRNSGRWKLFAVIAICASPLIASYFTYYVIKPEGRTNYGTLLDPRAYPMPVLKAKTLDGIPAELETLRGKWIMLQVAPGACDDACRKRLHDMRQLRLAQGKNMDRVERVWLINDASPLETLVMREYDGTHMLRADAQAIAAWLPAETTTTESDHLYVIDPLGNLMMRFPKDADPNRIKKDLSRLLRASSIG